MSNNVLSQPQAQPPRPPFPPHQNSYQRDFSTAPNGRPGTYNPQSPQMSMPYSSPSPQQYSPQQYSQPPAAKRPRLSPDAQSPFSQSSYPPTPSGQVGSPLGGYSINGSTSATSRPGLMAPPQRPADKAEERNIDDILSGTGINIEEEARNLTRQDYYGPPNPQASLQSRSNGFEYQSNSFGRPGSSGSLFGSQPGTAEGHTDGHLPQLTPEERVQRAETRADWEAARHSQNPLWDMFLYGGTLNDKIRKISLDEHLFDSQAGVMVNTQRQGPPPTARVNGLEGASRIIDKGQAVLDTGQKGDRLGDIMKLVSLATKSRLTGLLGASARLSLERREHSKGKVPTEWEDLAVVPKPTGDSADAISSPVGSTTLKRTYSQANSESASHAETGPATHRIASIFQKIAQAERAAEDARRVKRAKRKAAANPDGTSTPAGSDAAAEAALVAALDPEKKTTKKERKLAESKFSEQQQHKSANEATRMALSSIGGKRRNFGWLNPGAGGRSSTGATPGKPPPSTNPSAAVTPASERSRPAPKEKSFGKWDEDKDPGVQARDVLLVLETDGKAPRSYVRGYSLLDN